MLGSTLNIVSVCLAAASFWICWQVFYNIFLSPIRNIPGPLLAKISPVWLTLTDLAGDRTITLHKLHLKYGTAVRIGPTQVSFSDKASVRQIYGQQTSFLKAPLYEAMSMPPLGIFSQRDKYEHSQRRRLLSHVFSQSNLMDCEPLVTKIVKQLVEEHIERGVGKPLDVLLLFRLTSFDIVGELFLGQSFGGLDVEGEVPEILHDLDKVMLIGGLRWNFPWLIRLVNMMPSQPLRHFLAAGKRYREYGRNAFNTYVANHGRSSGRKDLLTKIISIKPDSGEATLSDLEIYTEIGNLVFAGTDTTSTTLTYLFWELARNPVWQGRVREELLSRTSLGNAESYPAYKDIQDLPLLDAVINEALRLHPAAPASLQRETPPGGRELDGYFIPEKTIVSMQCYTTQRDPTAFPNPHSFVPERWDNVTEDMKELFMPFSKGSRACLGINLALMELKLITASILRSYTITSAPTTTSDTMMMKDHFLAFPKGGKCDLIFSKIEGQ